MGIIYPVRDFIVQNFLFGEEGRITDDTSFLASNIIDSTGMLELAGFLEERFGITIEDDELIPENLDSLKNITHFLERKLDPAEPATTDLKAAPVRSRIAEPASLPPVEPNLPTI